MKKYLTAIFVLVVVSFSVQAQKIERFKGVYNIYDFEAECVNAAPPKGFEVFYISHYGRHGSRYIHAEDLYDTLNVILHKFELTAQGEVVRNVFDKYYPDVKGRAGDLSDLGEEQQRLLARRIVKDFPAMFKAGSQVVAYSSDVPRCMMSMYAFLDELRLIRGKLNIDARFDPRADQNRLHAVHNLHRLLHNGSKRRHNRCDNSPLNFFLLHRIQRQHAAYFRCIFILGFSGICGNPCHKGERILRKAAKNNIGVSDINC